MKLIQMKPQKSKHDFEFDGFRFRLDLQPTIDGGCVTSYIMSMDCPGDECLMEDHVHEQVVSKRVVRVEWWERFFFNFSLEQKLLTAIEVMRRQIEMSVFSYRKIKEIRERIEK